MQALQQLPQLQQMPPQLRMQMMQQQQQQQQQMMSQARRSESLGGTGSNPPSAPGSPRGPLSRQNSAHMQLDHQVSNSSAGPLPAKLDAASLLAAAAPKPKRQASSAPREGGVGAGNKKAAAAAAAAAAAYTALWKHTGPKEPRIFREPGVEYEEVCSSVGVVDTGCVVDTGHAYHLENSQHSLHSCSRTQRHLESCVLVTSRAYEMS
jgi:hypothetical protein